MPGPLDELIDQEKTWAGQPTIADRTDGTGRPRTAPARPGSSSPARNDPTHRRGPVRACRWRCSASSPKGLATTRSVAMRPEFAGDNRDAIVIVSRTGAVRRVYLQRFRAAPNAVRAYRVKVASGQALDRLRPVADVNQRTRGRGNPRRRFPWFDSGTPVARPPSRGPSSHVVAQVAAGQPGSDGMVTGCPATCAGGSHDDVGVPRSFVSTSHR